MTKCFTSCAVERSLFDLVSDRLTAQQRRSIRGMLDAGEAGAVFRFFVRRFGLAMADGASWDPCACGGFTTTWVWED